MILENADVHRMQRAFRSVLDAFAHPGTVYRIEAAPDAVARPAALDAALETAVRLFVDQAVTFAVADAESDALAAYISSETHATRVGAPEADFVIVPTRADGRTANRAVQEACRGTLVSPEKGATVFVGCTRIANESAVVEGNDPAMLSVEVCGPGVRDVNRFTVDRLEWARAREERRDEFPCGIDILLVDGEGQIVAIPRSSHVTCGDATLAIGEVR